MPSRALYSARRRRGKSGTAAVHRLAAGRPRRTLHRADEGGATAVWRAGTSPSSTLGLGPRGAYGRFRPLVPVRTVLCPGPILPPLRPRSALLHTNLFESGARYRAARGWPTLPTQPRRTHGPRGALAALAHPAPSYRSSGGAGGGRRKHRDAPGFPWQPCRCSTGCMDQRPCRREHQFRPHPERDAGGRAHCRADVPALWRGARALGPSSTQPRAGARQPHDAAISQLGHANGPAKALVARTGYPFSSTNGKIAKWTRQQQPRSVEKTIQRPGFNSLIGSTLNKRAGVIWKSYAGRVDSFVRNAG